MTGSPPSESAVAVTVTVAIGAMKGSPRPPQPFDLVLFSVSPRRQGFAWGRRRQNLLGFVL